MSQSDNQYTQFHFAVANVTFAWADIENQMVGLLCAMMSKSYFRVEKSQLAAAILFAPTSVDARLTIIDHAFVTIRSAMPSHEIISEHWTRLFRRLKKQKTTRNTVAHGQMVHFGGTDQKPDIRLTAPVLDPRYKKQKQNGLTIHELQQAARSMHDICEHLKIFTRLIRAWQDGNTQAYAEELLELQGQAPTSDSSPQNT